MCGFQLFYGIDFCFVSYLEQVPGKMASIFSEWMKVHIADRHSVQDESRILGGGREPEIQTLKLELLLDLFQSLSCRAIKRNG